MIKSLPLHAVLIGLCFSLPPALAPAAELPVPEDIVFERDVKFANPDHQHLLLNLARPQQAK